MHLAILNQPTINIRTQLMRIIEKAGLKPWPKLWQDLRSTRETELAESYPLHVVCAWIGNSQPVAAKHYLQVTDDHFEQAANGKRNGRGLLVINAAANQAFSAPRLQPPVSAP